MPDRPDIYIIPSSSCEEGTVIDHLDKSRYFPNSLIKACLILKAPTVPLLLPHKPQRVKCRASYGSNGGMIDFHIAACTDTEHASDVLNCCDGSLPCVIRFTATIADPPMADYLALHRWIERERGSKKVWLENVARFTSEEMAAGLVSLNSQLLRAYTMAYIFTSNENAGKACKDRGVVAIKAEDNVHSLTVSLRSPTALGWQANAGGDFRQNTADQMGMASDDVQAVIILSIPTRAIHEAGCANKATFTITEQADKLKLLRAEGGKAIYSSAYIVKIYELENDALVQVRRELAELIAADAGNEAQAALKLKIQQLRAKGTVDTADVQQVGARAHTASSS